MGLLGTSIDDPQTLATLQLAAGLLGPGNFGQAMSNGLLGYTSALNSAQDRAAKQAMMQAQMEDIKQQAALRQAQADQANRKLRMQEMAFGGGGLLGGGAPQSAGGMPAASGTAMSMIDYARSIGIPEQAIQADVAFNDGKRLSEMFMQRGTPKISWQGGVAVDENKVTPGLSLPQVSPTGQGYQNVLDPNSPTGFRTIVPPGAADVYSTFKNIDAGVAAKNDLVKRWNPITQRDEYVTRTQALEAAAPAAPARTVVGGDPFANLPTPAADATGKFVGDPRAVIAGIAEMKDPQERANAYAAFAKQLSASGGALPTEPMAAGQSTEEANKAAAGKEYDVQRAKDVVEQRKAIMAAGDAAPVNIAKYQQIGKLLSDVDGGRFTPTGYEVQSALNSLGVKIGNGEKLGNVQAAQAMANEAALQLRNPSGGAGMPGALSDQDRNFLASMTPNISQSADGRKKVIGAYVAVQQRNQQVAQFARNYEKKYGRLDNGFFDQLQAWSNANPLFGAQ